MGEQSTAGKGGSGARIGIYVVVGLVAAAVVWFVLARPAPTRLDAPPKPAVPAAQ